MARRFRAAVDGGSRGNPGPAAWGVAVLDVDGRVVERHAGTLGRATNNVAEYNAVIEALELARRARATEVEILADSELIVRQLEGSYRVRNASLRPLFERARHLIRGIDRFRIRHVRRADNREADRLVNEALDREAETGSPARIDELPSAPAEAD